MYETRKMGTAIGLFIDTFFLWNFPALSEGQEIAFQYGWYVFTPYISSFQCCCHIESGPVLIFRFLLSGNDY